MCRVRPGTVGFGPAPVPRMTSLVPLAFFRAAWTSCAAEPSGAVWEARKPAAASSVGIVARPASRLRRETQDGLDALVTVSPLSEPPRQRVELEIVLAARSKGCLRTVSEEK